MQPIQPSLAGLLGAVGRADAAPLRAQILDLPAQLLQSPAPVSLSGTVTDNSVPGQLKIATAIGDVMLRSPADLAVGRRVTIVTRPSVPTEVFLLSGVPAASTVAAGAVTVSAELPPQALPGQPPGIATAAAAAATGQHPSLATVPGATTDALRAAAQGGGAMTHATAAAFGPTPGPTSGPTLAPESLLATLGGDSLPDPVGRMAYVPALTSGPPSELLALLTDLRRLVASRDPKLAERMLRRLPTPDRGGALAMMALPEAARIDRLADWLGRDLAQVAEDGQNPAAPDLLARIGAALTHTEERVASDDERTWQWRQLPIVDNGHLLLCSVGIAPEYERPGSGANEGRRSERVIEFAVEVDLSALGHTRVEATYGERRLDLTVQCESTIDADSRAKIAESVAAVFEEFGLSGSCRFAPYSIRTAAAVKV